MLEILLRPFRALNRIYWDGVLSRESIRSKGSIILSLFIAGLAMAVVALVDRITGTYMPSILILALIAIALILDPLLTTLIGVVLSFYGDYFFIPPVGTFLTTIGDWEHMIILCGIGCVVSYLIQALRLSLIRQIDAQATRKSIGQAVKLISHDLRNPLGAIKMRAQMMKDPRTSPERRLELAAKIEQACNRMDQMIQAIINASLVKSRSDFNIDFTFCDLSSLVRETIEESFPESGHRLTLEVPTVPIYGFWGRDWIKRALENLVSNAVKYGSTRDTIEVRLEGRSGRPICLSVHNLGNEISASEQKKIFSTFFRGESAKDTVGWGLGLAMVRNVAEAHHGSVSVNSGAGQGTTFMMNFPPPQASGSEPLMHREE